MRALILSSLFCGAALAQVGGPLLGLVPEGSQIRPLYGLPAAGAIGAALSTGRAFSHVAVSPQQNFAVAVAADTGQLLIVTPGAGVTPLSVTETNPSALIASPHGTAAAAWFPLSGHLIALSGLPDSPQVRVIDASFLNASPLSIAMSDDGTWAAGLWGAGVYAFGPSGQVIPLQTDPGVTAIAFFHNSSTLALATANRATSIALGGSMTTSLLYDYSAQPLTPRAIALSFDNKITAIADVAGTVLTIQSGTATALHCGCAPEGLYGMGGALFRLNGMGATRHASGELKLFDAAAGAVWIVPPALALAGGRQ
jgi:hypothetical protein